MYIPSDFEVTDEAELFAVIERSGLATLISASDDLPTATLAPFAVSREESGAPRVWGHLARANPQSLALARKCRVLVLFRGPDAYVSPSWYADAPNVPTWNFVAVYAAGVARPVAWDDPRTRWILERTVAKHESLLSQPWLLDDVPESYLEPLLRAVFAFELEVSELRGQYKLSQNHPRANRRGVIQALHGMADDGSREIARLMTTLELRAQP